MRGGDFEFCPTVQASVWHCIGCVINRPLIMLLVFSVNMNKVCFQITFILYSTCCMVNEETKIY